MFALTVWADVVLWDHPASPWVIGLLCIPVGLILLWILMGVRYIPNNRVGIVEKFWSVKGSVEEGRLIALNGEAGFQSDVLRGGLHHSLWFWQYRIHKVALVTVPQGKIGYVYARDGEPLQPSQTLGHVVHCNNFQDARAFLGESESDNGTIVGQRGRQRAILREGVYAINLALFVVITEDTVYRLPLGGHHELETLVTWQRELRKIDGFSPVVVGASAAVLDLVAEEDEAPRRVRPAAKVVGMPIPEQQMPPEPHMPTGP